MNLVSNARFSVLLIHCVLFTFSGSFDIIDVVVTAVTCGQPSAPANGMVSGTSYDYGDVISYSCREKYNLTGGDVTRKCQSLNGNGSWSGSEPSCICKYIPEYQIISKTLLCGPPLSRFHLHIYYAFD